MPVGGPGAFGEAVGPGEFAGLMARFEPFGAARRVVVGMSGGADSMALAWLLRRWGAPLAVVADHGLRAGSGHEAEVTVRRLAGFGVPARVVRLRLAPGPDLGARARTARYAALLAACAAEGAPDLLVGHHARDQAETVVLRAGRGSGALGLAGMAPVSWRGEARVLRPLLGVAPQRLRATLLGAGVAWVEDPGNTDPATARGALRLQPIMAADGRAGAAREAAEAALAQELGRCVAIFPAGHAQVLGPMSEAAWSALVWTVSGRPYPPGAAAVRRLVRAGQGTLHGVRVQGGVVAREAEAPPAAARAGATWDGRFAVAAAPSGAEIGALGDDARALRQRPGPPAFALRTAPALRTDGKLSHVPHRAYADAESCRSVSVVFRPARPLAGAAFVAL